MNIENDGSMINNSVALNEKKLLLTLFFLLVAVSLVGVFYSPVLIILLPLSMLMVRYERAVFDWANLIVFYLAVLLLIPVNPYKMLLDLPVDLEFNRMAAVLMLFFWLIGLLIDQKIRIRRTHFELPLIAFSAVILMSMLVNQKPFFEQEQFIVTAKAIIRFASFVVIFYLVASVLRDKVRIERVLKSFAFLAMAISVVGIIERLTGYNFSYHLNDYLPFLYADSHYIEREILRGEVIRVTSTIDHPIALSVILAMILPITVHYILVSKTVFGKAFYLVSAGLSVITMLLTVSATVLVSLAIIVGWLMTRNFRYGLLMVLLVAIGLLIVTSSFPGTLEALSNRISPDYLTQKEIRNTTGGRFSDYPKIWREFSYKPWFGHGFGTFINNKYFYLDNQYLKFAYELGLFGLATFIWLFVAIVKRFLQTSQHLAHSGPIMLALMTGLLVYMVTCMTFDTFGYIQVTQLFFVLVAVGVSLINVQEGSS